MTWGEGAVQPLAETFDGAFGSPGVVTAAACTDETGTAVAVNPGDTPADGRFETGSVTKTMTAALLALLEADGRLRLDDEVSRWVPAGANGAVTLRQLATHTSGLPRLAPNFDLRAIDRANPYAAFGAAQGEEGLRQAALAPDRPHLYSNFGYQLLGLVLERASGLSYQELLAGRLLEPLGMTCSGVGGSGGGIRLPGHAHGGEVPHWDHPLAGAGGVEATISDLAAYAQACLHPPRTPLGAALTAAQAPQVPLGNGRHQALGWQVREDGTRVHGGGTGGFSAAVLIDRDRGRAVAMLASCGGYARTLGQAGLLALADDDPRTARPQPPGPEWDDRAREIIWALLDGRTGDIRARASSAFQPLISSGQLERAWQGRTQGLGPATDVQVACQRPADRIAADTTITFANGTLALRMVFEPAGQLAGLKILPPQEEAPTLPD
jgi:D-alanyl-D-alanine-carboxypeptidase/D-alanyl-D-alanine-endopeptidase